VGSTRAGDSARWPPRQNCLPIFPALIGDRTLSDRPTTSKSPHETPRSVPHRGRQQFVAVRTLQHPHWGAFSHLTQSVDAPPATSGCRSLAGVRFLRPTVPRVSFAPPSVAPSAPADLRTSTSLERCTQCSHPTGGCGVPRNPPSSPPWRTVDLTVHQTHSSARGSATCSGTADNQVARNRKPLETFAPLEASATFPLGGELTTQPGRSPTSGLFVRPKISDAWCGLTWMGPCQTSIASRRVRVQMRCGGVLTPLDQASAEKLAAQLAGGHWTHDYALPAHEAQEIGLPVTVGMPRS